MKQQLNLPTKSHQGIIRLNMINMLKIQSPKKNTVQNIIWMVILLKTHQPHFWTPKTWTHRFDPPGAPRLSPTWHSFTWSKKTQLQSWITWNSQFPGWSLRRNLNESTHLLLSFYVLNVHGGKCLYQITSIAAFKNPGGLHQGGFSTKNLRQRLWLGLRVFIIWKVRV